MQDSKEIAEHQHLENQELNDNEILEPEQVEADSNQSQVQLEIDSLKEQIATFEEKLLRTSAEAENMRKRYERMIQDAKDYANTNFAKDLLNVLDNLNRALEFKPTQVDSQTSNIILGVEMTKNELDSILQKYGIQVIDPQLGEKFDYNFHNSMSQIVTDEYNEGSVVQIIRKGYKMKERILRVADVIVAKRS